MSSEANRFEIPLQVPITRIVHLALEAETDLSIEDLHTILSDAPSVSTSLAGVLIDLGIISEIGDVGMWTAKVFEVAQPNRN